MEELLAPDHAGEGLALDAPGVRIVEPGLQLGVELVGLGAALLQHLVEVRKRVGKHAAGQAQAETCAAPTRDLGPIVNPGLGAVMRRIHGVLPAGDQILVERVLEMALHPLDPEQPPDIRVVVAEQQRRLAVGVESVAAEQLALDRDGRAVVGVQIGAVRVGAP